jgi:heptosyltransferase-3
MTYGNYPDLNHVKRVLVVKLRHHGDVLLTSPVFSFLKKSLPEAQIDAFLYADTLPMLEGHPAISGCILYDRKIKNLSFFKRIKKEIELLWKVRKKGYDLVVNLTEGDRGALIALFSKSPLRVGFDPGKSGFFGKRKIYTHLAKVPKTPRHTVEKQLDVLRKIGLFPAVHERGLTFHIPSVSLGKMRNLLQEENLEEGNFYLIHPVSRWKFKCPPPSFTADLIRNLRLPVVLTSGPDAEERALILQILALIPEIPVLDLGGKITLKELGALIQLSRYLICVDSVPFHMASALKAPVVALFGPTSEDNWGPWQNPHAKIVSQKYSCRPCNLDGCGGSKRSDCLYTLTVQQVLDALENPSNVNEGSIIQPF